MKNKLCTAEMRQQYANPLATIDVHVSDIFKLQKQEKKTKNNS